MAYDTADRKANVLSALAHSNRIRIIDSLREGPRCNCELEPLLSLEQSNLSRHLRLMVQAGVLISRREGVRINYEVADRRIFEILELAASIAQRHAEEMISC